MSKVFVTVKFRIPGFHCWPNAPDNQAYLRELHRHEFHFTVWLEVFHNDREVEFIKLKEELVKFIQNAIAFCGMFGVGREFSCETLADSICDWLGEVYPGRDRKAWVEEDGENGAFVVQE